MPNVSESVNDGGRYNSNWRETVTVRVQVGWAVDPRGPEADASIWYDLHFV